MERQDPIQALRAFSEHYDYDVGYLEQILRVSPAAFENFWALTALSRHREAAPVDAAFAAKLVGALTEDCGPCLDLVIKMAREAGMEAEQVAAVLSAEEGAMSEATRLAYRFATAVAARGAAEDEARDAVAAAWGEAGVLDLTLSLQVGRLFPMVKAGLGYAKACRRVEVDGRPVRVVRHAA